MRTVCLVNNFNYERFLKDALSSVEKQSVPFDQVIVVDDGSVDGSREIISLYCDRLPGWQAVFKKNGGQLSCFNSGVSFVEPEDLVTFLDADDMYPANYLELLIKKNKEIKADFYFCDIKHFEAGEALASEGAEVLDGMDFLIESSTALARHFKRFMGSPTSAIALRGYLYCELLPYPHERDWMTRADDVLVHGSSILNARKAFLGSLGVNYRVHASNHFYGKKFSEAYKLRRSHLVETMYGWYCQKHHVSTCVDFKQVEREYALIPEELRIRFNFPKNIKKLSLYVKFLEKLNHWLRLLKASN